MEKERSPLRFGSPLRFHDRWEGRLDACEVDADWAVCNLIISRGLVLRQSVRLPFSAVSQWSADVVTLDCAADEAFGRHIPAEPPGQRLDSRTRVAGTQARLVGLLVEHRSRRATHLLLERGPFLPEDRLLPIQEAVLKDSAIVLSRQLEAYPIYRSDDDLIHAVRAALADHPYLSEDDRRGLIVEASDGVLYLRGNVRTAAARGWAQQCAQQVDGALEIRNEVIDDPALEIAVAKALAEASLFRQARVFVRAVRGDIILTGYVPSLAVQREIERVAAAVEGVRGLTAKLQFQPAE